MNIYRKSFSVIILASISSLALAVPISEKRQVLQQAKGYAQAVACSTTFDSDSEGQRTSLRDVYLVESQEGFEGNEIGTKYIVYWSGDWGCAGGSGTYSSFLTSFSRMSETRPFLFDKMDILDDINGDDYESYQINSRFIEDIDYDSGVLKITASDYSNDGSHEANNFPSNRFKYTVAYDQNSGEWILTHKKFIGKNKY